MSDSSVNNVPYDPSLTEPEAGGGSSPAGGATTARQAMRRAEYKVPSWRAFLAETFGTFLLVALGCGVNAQNLVSDGKSAGSIDVHIGWGLAVMTGMVACAGVSGAHLNPAVTVTFALHRRTTWRRVPVYVGAQFLGAFIGAAAVYGVYADAIGDWENNNGGRTVASAGIFASYPHPSISLVTGFFDQVIGTALLTGGVFAISDRRNAGLRDDSAPVHVAALLTIIACAFGFNCGFPVNPARDFSPRLFSAIAGWGGAVFTAGNNWWWVPVIAPMIGGFVGSLTYEAMIGWHHEKKIEVITAATRV